MQNTQEWKKHSESVLNDCHKTFEENDKHLDNENIPRLTKRGCWPEYSRLFCTGLISGSFCAAAFEKLNQGLIVRITEAQLNSPSRFCKTALPRFIY